MKSFLLALASSACLISFGARAELVTYFAFDGNALDTSGKGNNGTVHGATLVSNRLGQVDSAYHFDGVDDFIAASASGLPAAERTVAFWFLADSVANRPVMLGYGCGSCGTS
jgi:hypothetical protein